MKPFFTSKDFSDWKPHALSGSTPDFQDMADIANAKVAPLLEENERLKKQLEATIEVAQMRGAAACDGVERIAQLEEALKGVICADKFTDAYVIARAALGEKE